MGKYSKMVGSLLNTVNRIFWFWLLYYGYRKLLRGAANKTSLHCLFNLNMNIQNSFRNKKDQDKKTQKQTQNFF